MPYEQFQINADAILASLDYLDTMGARAPEISKQMRSIAKIALINVFQEAVEEANSNDGFPYEFQNHMMSVVRNFQGIDVSWGSGELFIGVDFDELGTEDELRRAFHQGARLQGGGHVWGPYNGEPLAAQDTEQAHIFWEAVRYNQETYFNPINGKRIAAKHVIKYPWEEVVNKYVEIWGEKAPEWLFMQYGQEEYEPSIPQIDIIGRFEEQLYALSSELLYDFVDREVTIAESYRTVGADVGFTVGGQPQLTSPLLTIGEKVYRKGQFVPKNF